MSSIPATVRLVPGGTTTRTSVAVAEEGIDSRAGLAAKLVESNATF
jgi:hypothetical protein